MLILYQTISIRRLLRRITPPEETADPEPKQKPKRKPLPPTLPRNEQILSRGEACKCGGELRAIGEDATEELEYVPGRFIVNRIVRPRMACKCCDKIVQAALPSRPIERGRPGAGLLAHVLVNKYADHCPLYRQSQIFAREDIDLDRSTLAGWVGQSTKLLEPLADAIGRYVRAGEAIFADDTPIKMQAKKKCATARIWTYVRDERPWDSQAPPAAWYKFSTNCEGKHPTEHLANYQGWIHADGYTGFNDLFAKDNVHEMACMAHVRRKFVDIFQSQGSQIAEEANLVVETAYNAAKVPSVGNLLLPDRETIGRFYIVEQQPVVSADDIVDARPDFARNGPPAVWILLDPLATERFRQVTSDNIGKSLAIVLNGEVISAPMIQSSIPNGEIHITGNFTGTEAANLANVVRLGE